MDSVVTVRPSGYNFTMASNGKLKKVGPTRTSRVNRRKWAVPIWDRIVKIAETIPPAELHKLPTDLAANHDHYLYGTSLR